MYFNDNIGAGIRNVFNVSEFTRHLINLQKQYKLQ